MGRNMRAVGIIRVSKVAGREGDSFASPALQSERINAICAANGWKLVEPPLPELDVSGGKTLAKRPGLSRALYLIEAGKADIMVAAYFDRLFRSLSTQQEVVDRVEQADGQVFSVDMGQVSNATAGQWLTGTLIGTVSEYYRRQTGEKLREAAVRAALRGVYSGPIPLGYVKAADGHLEPDPKLGPVVAEMFSRRADGASLRELCELLREHGVERWPSPVSNLLRSRIYLGEVTYGETVTVGAHPAIVKPDVWRRAQLRHGRAGRKPATARLLTQMGVLRCSGCGRSLSLASSNGMGAAPRYRCLSGGSKSFCAAPVTIKAQVADDAVAQAVRARAAGIRGRGNTADDIQSKIAALDAAQEALDGTLATFQAAGLLAEPKAVARLTELRESRDAKQAGVDLHADADDVLIGADRDWDDLNLDEQRALVAAIVASATVLPNMDRWGDQSARLKFAFKA